MKGRRSLRATLPKDRTAVTIKDVAKAAGVSTATVSRVFSGGAIVAEDLRDRVRQAAMSLNYRPNRIARNLRIRQTRTVGVVIPDVENPFFTSVVCGVEEVLRAADYSLLLANSNENAGRERRNVEALQAEAVAGIIFTPSGTDLSFYRDLSEAGMALVAVSRSPGDLDVDTVMVSNREGTQEAIAHLISLGHARVAMISGPPWVTTARDRLRGYEEALSAAGLPHASELIRYADFRQAGGYAAMKQLLALRPRPTAVFAGSNLMTLGTLQAIHEAGLRIPQHMAIAGFDDMPWAVSLQPPLTVVAQPAFEIGVSAARLLMERLADPAAPRRHVVHGTRLIVRASSGAAVGKAERKRQPK